MENGAASGCQQWDGAQPAFPGVDWYYQRHSELSTFHEEWGEVRMLYLTLLLDHTPTDVIGVGAQTGHSRNVRCSRDLLCREVTSGSHPSESRRSDAVEMDEMMAAMVLTSLSCSPVVQSPPGGEANFSGEERGRVGSGCGRGFLSFGVRGFHSLSSVSSSGEKFPGAL